MVPAGTTVCFATVENFTCQHCSLVFAPELADNGDWSKCQRCGWSVWGGRSVCRCIQDQLMGVKLCTKDQDWDW